MHIKRWDRSHFAVTLILSAITTFFVLNRWVFTEIGILSFGRLWPFYVSWTDFGFTRRSLVGTVLTVSGLNSLYGDRYIWSLTFYAIVLAVLMALVAAKFLRDSNLASDKWLFSAVFLSPAFFSHLAYATGSLDIFLVLILCVVVFHVKSAPWATALVAAGVLTHELFVFLIPSILLLSDDRPSGRVSWCSAKRLGIVFASLAAVGTVQVFGRLDVSQRTFEAKMESRLKDAARDHPLWSGYFELGSTTMDNFNKDLSLIPQNWRYVLVPVLYACLASFGLAIGMTASPLRRFALVIATLTPLAATLVATDFYRWVSLSCIVSLVAMVKLTSSSEAKIPRAILVLLTGFAMFSPFGAAGLQRPFPLHQLFLESLSG